MTNTDTSAKRWTVKGWDDDHIEFEDDGGKWVAWNDYCALAAERDRYKARAEQAEGALDKLASMACIGSGIALGRDLLRDANEGDRWADEMAARVKFARAALAQIDTEHSGDSECVRCGSVGGYGC